MQIHEYLELKDGEIVCVKCGHRFGPADENYKLGALQIDRKLEEANPLLGDAGRYVDADVVFRQYVCPGCGVLLDNEIARVDDPPLWDIRISA